MIDPNIHAAYDFVPPSDITGMATTDPEYVDMLFNAAMTESVSGTAAQFDLADCADSNTRPEWFGGGHWVTIEAKDSNIWVRLRSRSGAGATTTDTGMLIEAGKREHFFVTVDRRYADVIAAAADTILWWRSSRRRKH